MKPCKSELLPPAVYRYYLTLKRNLLNKGSTGLNQLDIRLIKAINPSKNGYFVELGANDGLRQSNTYRLQADFGWTGLLIEPSPIRFRECIANRSFANKPFVRCNACVPFEFDNRFVEIEDADLMSIAKGLDISDSHAVKHANQGLRFLDNSSVRFSYGAIARTLTSLLEEVDAPRGFDLLSLDVEGNELAVLRGLDFEKYRPKWILVEVRDRDHIFAWLSNAGYGHVEDLSNCSEFMYSDCLFRDNRRL